MTPERKVDIVLGMFKKGLVEEGGLESEILELMRDRIRKGFVGEYDGDKFYYESDVGLAVLSLTRDNPVVLEAFQKYLRQGYSERRINGEIVVYRWKGEDYFKKS